jgi:hypothetical protein
MRSERPAVMRAVCVCGRNLQQRAPTAGAQKNTADPSRDRRCRCSAVSAATTRCEEQPVPSFRSSRTPRVRRTEPATTLTTRVGPPRCLVRVTRAVGPSHWRPPNTPTESTHRLRRCQGVFETSYHPWWQPARLGPMSGGVTSPMRGASAVTPGTSSRLRPRFRSRYARGDVRRCRD